MYNSLGWNTIWDGIACEDRQKRLYFDSENGFAMSEFQMMTQSQVNIGNFAR